VSRHQLPSPGRTAPGHQRAIRALRGIALATLAGLSLAACSGGAIGQDNPASSGISYVGGNAGAAVFKTGARPLAPDVSGTTLSGQSLRLAGYRGEVVVVNFWGSWCTPCRAEAPALATLSRTYQPGGVRFVGVDIRDTAATAGAFIRDFGIGYPSLTDPGDEIALQFRDTVPPAGIPTTLVIDRTGHIAGRIIGQATYSSLQSMISQITATQ
jgi:thiol-disulfide isomerase/thioredoxin